MWNWFKKKEKPKLNYYKPYDRVYFMGMKWHVLSTLQWDFEREQSLKLVINYGLDRTETSTNNTQVKPVVRAYALLV